MLGLILAAATTVTPTHAPTPMWGMNFSAAKPSERCYRTDLKAAFDKLAMTARDDPLGRFTYQWLFDHQGQVLRITTQVPGQKSAVPIFYLYNEQACRDNWSAYRADPLWGYDRKNVVRVMANGDEFSPGPPLETLSKLPGSPAPSITPAFKPPKTLYAMDWEAPPSSNCRKIDTDALFDKMHDDIVKLKQKPLRAIIGFYDQNTFVFAVILSSRKNGEPYLKEAVYSSSRAHCLARSAYFHKEAERVSRGGAMYSHPGDRDFTDWAIGIESSFQLQKFGVFGPR